LGRRARSHWSARRAHTKPRYQFRFTVENAKGA
jgi:hypothetical protein